MLCISGATPGEIELSLNSPLMKGFIVLFLFILLVLGGFKGGIRRAKVYPNQGVWLSARNGIKLSLAATSIALITIIAIARDFAARDLLNLGFYGTLFLLFPGLIFGLWYGGLAFLRHFLLRLLLTLRSKWPWNAVPFLDFAADRALLYKVGGGYVFIHRLLLEHFAALEPESPR
jgi:hypothetical protein